MVFVIIHLNVFCILFNVLESNISMFIKFAPILFTTVLYYIIITSILNCIESWWRNKDI
jgi:hypothetical protein